MLLVTKSHHEPDDILPDRENTRRMSLCKESVSPWTGASQFLATTNKIIQFSNGREAKVERNCYLYIKNEHIESSFDLIVRLDLYSRCPNESYH
jgi:hypothetical protein